VIFEVGTHQCEGFGGAGEVEPTMSDKMEGLEFYDHCLLGKSLRLKFETSKHVSISPLTILM